MIHITDINSSGQGVGKDGDIVTFIPYTLVGEQVEAEIISHEKKYQIGVVKEIVKQSNKRCQPVCPYYGKCGGCNLMHMTYGAQLEAKENIVKNAMTRIGKVNCTVSPILPCNSQFNYRNKASFPVKNGKVGYYEASTHNIVEINSCPLLKEDINDALSLIRPFISKYSMGVSHVVIRSTCGQTMITLVTGTKDFPYKNELISCLKPLNPASINLNINTNPRHILGNKTVNIYGAKHTKYEIGGNTFKVSPTSFLQVNDAQTHVLYNTAVSLTSIENQPVIDAYCGIGTISLMLAKKAKSVLGVELNPSSIANAKQSALENGLSNASFICGKCQDVISQLIKEQPTTIFVDPPRAGVDKAVINAICSSAIKNIVYVSCNPSTLARDTALLCNQGYSVEKIIPVDMFPSTAHVETIVLIQRKSS